MIVHLRRYGPFAAIFLFVCAGLWKTRAEQLRSRAEAWKKDSSTDWVEAAYEHNPSIWWPNPKDVAEGKKPVGPIKEPVRPADAATVLIEWNHGPTDVSLRESGPGGEPYIARVVGDYRALSRELPPKE